MQRLYDIFSNISEVFVKQSEESDSSTDCENSFERFERGYCSQACEMSATHIIGRAILWVGSGKLKRHSELRLF
jgi:hypothetical protein